jgi:hypothetical protein
MCQSTLVPFIHPTRRLSVADRTVTNLVKVQAPSIQTKATNSSSPSRLVDEDLQLYDREDVRNQLPDIIAQVLARVWVDPNFRIDFTTDPILTLRNNGVFLPETMFIEFSVAVSERPKVIVYEQHPHSKFRLRVFYLQLVMIAGR